MQSVLPVFSMAWVATLGTKPTSLALKSMVRALPSFMIMVMRPLPASQNCHSLALGCQCNSRKAPGLRVTSAAATFLLGGKLRESTIRTSPPGVFLLGAMLDILNVYWMGDSARRPPIAALSCARD